MLHRALFGSFERFIGLLIEHYAGAFPLWFSPEQVRVISVGEKHVKRVQEVVDQLKLSEIRATVDVGDDSVGKKIRNAEKEKVPYMLVIGDKEVESGEVNVRRRGQEEQESLKVEALIEELSEKIRSRQ